MENGRAIGLAARLNNPVSGNLGYMETLLRAGTRRKSERGRYFNPPKRDGFLPHLQLILNIFRATMIKNIDEYGLKKGAFCSEQRNWEFSVKFVEL